MKNNYKETTRLVVLYLFQFVDSVHCSCPSNLRSALSQQNCYCGQLFIKPQSNISNLTTHNMNIHDLLASLHIIHTSFYVALR